MSNNNIKKKSGGGSKNNNRNTANRSGVNKSTVNRNTTNNTNRSSSSVNNISSNKTTASAKNMTVGVSSNASTPKGSGTVKYSAQSANVSRTTSSTSSANRSTHSTSSTNRSTHSTSSANRSTHSTSSANRSAHSASSANRSTHSTGSASRSAHSTNSASRSKNSIARKKRKRRNRILRNVGLVMSLVLFVITIVFIWFMHKVDLLPTEFEILISALLILIVAFIAITQRWVGMGVFTKILAVVMSVVLVIGSVYMDATHKAIKKMSNETTIKSVVGVYVLKDSGIEDILALDKARCGRLTSLDEENTRKMIDHIQADSHISLSYKGYDGIAEMVQGLYSKDIKCMIFNSSYMGILSEMEEFKNFESDTKCIYTQEYTTQIVQKEPTESTKDHIITMYISGIDTRTGDVNSNSNSDVNILCIANLKTHQILLINTPRDYYIPTSVSNGAKDKLTHAGVYGVDCSMDTLELLYDTNIDYYFKVNFTGFISIVDQLGGITVHSDYDFVTTHGGDHIVVGKNYLTGKQALGFVRERYAFATGDNQRGKNTMTVIKALVTKMASSAMLANYTNVLDSISDCMVTNMSYEKIGEIAKQQLNGMPSWDVQQFSVEGSGATKSTYSYKPPTYVMIPKYETVDQAKAYIKAISNDEVVKVQ